MSKYEKPIVIINDEVSEGVYAASGCFVSSAEIVQTPELGNNTYCVQMKASHDASDSHHSSIQKFQLVFNQAVTYKSSNAISCEGSGTNVITLEYNYHANGVESIGLGNVYVESGDGLTLISCSNVYCNLDCFTH